MELRETETETAKLTWMREDCENVKWAGDGGKRGETQAGMWRQRMRERERENNPSVSLARQLNACHIMRWSLAALSLETHTHETHTYTTQTWHTHTHGKHTATTTTTKTTARKAWNGNALVVSLSLVSLGIYLLLSFLNWMMSRVKGRAGTRGREGIPRQVGDFCIRVVAMRRKRQSTEKVSPRLVSSRFFFIIIFCGLMKY